MNRVTGFSTSPSYPVKVCNTLIDYLGSPESFQGKTRSAFQKQSSEKTTKHEKKRYTTTNDLLF